MRPPPGRLTPAASQLTDGHFRWTPAVGYFGTYDVVFLDGSQQVPVTVTIYGASEQSQIFLGAAELGLWRPDVGAQLGPQFEQAGWQLVAPPVPPGDYDVVAYFWSTKTGRFEDARVVRVSAR